MKYWPVSSFRSIRLKMIVAVCCILVPLIGLLIFNNFYAIRVIHNQVAESNRNRLIQYMKQVDTNFDIMDTYLSSMAAFDLDIQILSMQTDEDSRLVAQSDLSNKLTKDILAYRSMDCIFVYNTVSDEFIYGNSELESYYERESMKNYIMTALDIDPKVGDYLMNKKWFVKKVGGQYYLMRLFKSNNSYVGAWVRVKQLMTSMNFKDMGRTGISMFTTMDGKQMAVTSPISDKKVVLTGSFERYYLTGEYNQYLLVGANSNKGEFKLIELIKDNTILEKLPVLNHVITTIAIGSILLLPLSLFLLHRFVLKPLNRVLTAMKKVRDGNIEVRIREYDTSDEFKLVNDTFNSMLDQIQDLKINIYEEQLSKQRAELEHLQLQVNPHFFLNSLNIIYRLAQTRKYELIQDMSICLLQYFRYMFRNNLKFVTIREELEHVSNYIRIQELRFPGNLTYRINAEDFIMDKPIPPLAIQNFIENSVKYAITLDEPIHLSVDIEYQKIGEKDFIRIMIQDTGKGFSEEILDKLQAGVMIADELGDHVGIWNVQRRLELLYDGAAKITFSNKEPSGAVVEINLPLKVTE